MVIRKIWADWGPLIDILPTHGLLILYGENTGLDGHPRF